LHAKNAVAFTAPAEKARSSQLGTWREEKMVLGVCNVADIRPPCLTNLNSSPSCDNQEVSNRSFEEAEL
jgi:hypothetical protein